MNGKGCWQETKSAKERKNCKDLAEYHRYQVYPRNLRIETGNECVSVLPFRGPSMEDVDLARTHLEESSVLC